MQAQPKVCRKVLIVGNCQVQPLRHGLSLYVKDIQFDSLGVHLTSGDARSRATADLLSRKDDYSFVLSMILSDEFGPLARDQIEEAFHPIPVIFISNLTFTGLHPDLTYLGGMSRRLAGPTGDYHSKIAALSFVFGLSVSETVSIFCDFSFRTLGYYDIFEEAIQEMATRDRRATIPIGEDLERLVRQGYSFFSHNHPTSFILEPYIEKIAAWLSLNKLACLSGWTFGAYSLPNYLAESSIFPVYPEIAARCKLPYNGSYLFKPPTNGGLPVNCLDLEEFVAAEFRAFGDVGVSELEGCYPINLMRKKYNLLDIRDNIKREERSI